MPGAETPDPHVNTEPTPEGASRRAVLAGAAGIGVAAALGGCSVYGGSEDKPAPAKGGGSGGELGKVADIPVGGGKVFAQDEVVVTQPEQGTFKGFSSTCTHQGCTVATVKGGTINCECHGSKFKIADGSVADGPATKPLPAVNVAVKGDGIVKA
jgi:Rieske Fe-S protein